MKRHRPPIALNRWRYRADHEGVGWLSLVAVAILGWLAIALAVGTVVGHGIAFGTGSDRDY